jgi:hypothetical protein
VSRMTVARVARRYMWLTGCSIHQTAYDLTMVRRRVVNAKGLWGSICALAAEESKPRDLAQAPASWSVPIASSGGGTR